MQFQKIIGQEKIKQRLVQSVLNQRISHSQMFYGLPGTGKLGLAIAYAQYVCCTNKQANDSCGQCASCRKYEKLIHPDLHFVFPVVRTSKFKEPVSDNFIAQWREFILESPYRQLEQWLQKLGTENLQGSIYTHESGEIIRKLNLKTYEADYKVMIIWMPEKMNISAANKLLKMIEEPPPKTLFIMVSEAPDMVLRTIVSRTQLTKVPKIDQQSLRAHFEQTPAFDLSAEDIEYVVKLGNGNYIKALDAIEMSAQTRQNFELFTHWMRLCYAKKVIEVADWSDQLVKKGREQQKNFLLYALQSFRDNFVMNMAETPQQITAQSKEEAAFAQKFHSFINENNIQSIFNELNQAYYHLQRNASDKILFLDLSLKMIKLLQKGKPKK